MTSIPPRPRIAQVRSDEILLTTEARADLWQHLVDIGASTTTSDLLRAVLREAEAAAIPAQDSRPLDAIGLKEAARELAYRVQAIAKDYGQDHQPTGDWPEVWRAWDRFMVEYTRLAGEEPHD